MLHSTAVPADLSQFRPQDAGGWKPGLAMALFVHLLLVGALALGVHWKIKEPAAVEAEVWTDVPKVPVHPTPEPPAEVTPPPTPAQPPEPAVEKPVEKPADLSIAPVKPKVAKKEAKKEPKEVFLPDPPKKVPPQKVPPKAEAKPEKTPPKPVPPTKPPLDAKAEAKAEAKAKAAEAARAQAEAKNLAAQRQANLDRLMRNLAQDQNASAGISDAYKGRIVARVMPNVIYSGNLSDKLQTLVRVECNADGKITHSAILAGSGNDQWDKAVIKALERTQVLPQDEHKRVPCPFDFVFTPPQGF